MAETFVCPLLREHPQGDFGNGEYRWDLDIPLESLDTAVRGPDGLLDEASRNSAATAIIYPVCSACGDQLCQRPRLGRELYAQTLKEQPNKVRTVLYTRRIKGFPAPPTVTKPSRISLWS